MRDYLASQTEFEKSRGRFLLCELVFLRILYIKCLQLITDNKTVKAAERFIKKILDGKNSCGKITNRA